MILTSLISCYTILVEVLMNDLQKCELDLLKKAIEVIERHGLRYFLVGGTTLGAIRHQGFIPWDDDVDIGLPREDYDKLMELQDEFKGEYFLQNYKTDPKYPYNFAKLRNSNTTFVENTFQHLKMNHGVYIDIFPIDGVSKKKKVGFKAQFRLMTVWLRFYLIYLGRFRRVKARSFYKDLPMNFIALFFFVFNLGHFLNKSIDKSMRKVMFKDAELVANFQGASFGHEILDKSLLLEDIKVKFEDIEDAVVPKEYDAYLTFIYGSYMTPPPPEKQVGHHHYAKKNGFSLDESYRTFYK